MKRRRKKKQEKNKKQQQQGPGTLVAERGLMFLSAPVCESFSRLPLPSDRSVCPRGRAVTPRETEREALAALGCWGDEEASQGHCGSHGLKANSNLVFPLTRASSATHSLTESNTHLYRIEAQDGMVQIIYISYC